MQLDAAIAFVKKLTKDAKVNVKEFEESSGVGIETTEKEILDFVAKIFEEHKVQLLETGESYIGSKYIYLIVLRGHHSQSQGSSPMG